MNIKVNIENFGNYSISPEKLQELLGWLAANQAVQIPTQRGYMQEIVNSAYSGSQLING
jgi:hypothetical protein